MMLVNGLFFMILFCFWSLRNPNDVHRVMLLGLAPLMFFFVAHFVVPDLVIRQSAPGRLLDKNQRHLKSDDIIIACEEAVGAVCWTLKRNNVYLLGPAGELTYGSNYKDGANRLLDIHSAARLIDQNRNHVAIIASIDKIRVLRQMLPTPVSLRSPLPG